MSGLEALGAVVGVVAVVAQIISAYRDGGGIIDRVKEKRAARRGRPLPKQLEESVKETPGDIERETNRGLSKFGPAFEQGDYIAIITIQNIAIQVHSKFFEKLRTAYEEDTDFTSLIHDADMGRNHTIQALIELQQRLLLAAPMQREPVLAQPPLQTFGPNGGPQVGMAQVVTFPPLQDRDRDRNLLENSPQPEARFESQPRDQRQHRFNLFHKSREQAQPRQGSHDRVSEWDQNGLPRVYTLPSNASDFGTSPSSINSNNSTNYSLQRTTMPVTPTPQQIRQSPVQINEPWDNPWAEDYRSARPSVSSASMEPDFAFPARTSTSRSGSSTNTNPIPHPNPSNNYLGFCKGAWKLQGGDTKAMVVSRDFTQSAQSKVKLMRCSECKFEGHFDPSNIWTRVFRFDGMGMKIRWSFLAKSHVSQKYPQRRDLARACDFTYQCIFCAFLGLQSPAIHGAQAYRDHISQQHHGATMSELVLYKAGAVDDRVCSDTDDFDINLYPRRSSQFSELSGQSIYA